MKMKFISVLLTAALTSVATLFIAGKFEGEIPFIQKEQRLPVKPPLQNVFFITRA